MTTSTISPAPSPAPTATPSAPASPTAPAASPVADVLRSRAPALSATSDMPIASPAPAPTADPPAASAPATATVTDPEDGDGSKPDLTPAWQKAEITKERNRRRAAEEAAAKERERAEAAERRLDEALKAVPKPTDPPAAAPTELPRPKRPQREAFDDPDAYEQALAKHEDALIEWSSKRVATDVSKQVEETRQAEAKKAEEARKAEEQRVSSEAVARTWMERRAKAIEETPDFEAVAENPDVKITPAMGWEIAKQANGPQIAYHLGKHPDEAARIALLDPIEAVVELRILARQLATPKPPEITKAPDPVRTVGARASATTKSPDEESMDEYAKRRNKDLNSAVH